ncbi:MAG: hypothetical protein ACI8RD_007633, partial [Bacillariaceae sp.]
TITSSLLLSDFILLLLLLSSLLLWTLSFSDVGCRRLRYVLVVLVVLAGRVRRFVLTEDGEEFVVPAGRVRRLYPFVLTEEDEEFEFSILQCL